MPRTRRLKRWLQIDWWLIILAPPSPLGMCVGGMCGCVCVCTCVGVGVGGCIP